MKYELRPYQLYAIEQIRQAIREGHKRIVLQAPTGAGKTAIAAHIVRSAYEKQKKAYFICDRIELIEQAVERFDAEEIPLGVCQADHDRTDRTHRVQVASIQTMTRRMCVPASLYIYDEAHCLHKAHIKLMADNPDSIFIGLTATPWAKGMGKYFSKLVVVSTVKKLTDDDFLVPIITYGPSKADLSKVKIVSGDYEESGLAAASNTKVLIGSIVNHWRKLAFGRKTFCFAVNIAHSMAIVESFNAVGIKAVHIDCYTKPDEREKVFDDFREGPIQILSSVDICTKGVDIPAASCGILARSTKSLILYIQQVGRLARICDGKSDAIILDHSGNTEAHGYFDNDRNLELDDGKKKEAKPKDAQKEERLPKPCPSCHFMKVSHKCPKCGFAPKTKPKGIEHVEGDLVLLKGKEQKKEKYTVEQKDSIYAQLLGYAQSKGYNKGWAYHKCAEITGKHPTKKTAPVTPEFEVINIIRHLNIKNAKRKEKQFVNELKGL